LGYIFLYLLSTTLLQAIPGIEKEERKIDEEKNTANIFQIEQTFTIDTAEEK
jgi:hypothetical protein